MLVVDFVNSVGTIREAFEEYYAATTLTTGRRGGLYHTALSAAACHEDAAAAGLRALASSTQHGSALPAHGRQVPAARPPANDCQAVQLTRSPLPVYRATPHPTPHPQLQLQPLSTIYLYPPRRPAGQALPPRAAAGPLPHPHAGAAAAAGSKARARRPGQPQRQAGGAPGCPAGAAGAAAAGAGPCGLLRAVCQVGGGVWAGAGTC